MNPNGGQIPGRPFPESFQWHHEVHEQWGQERLWFGFISFEAPYDPVLRDTGGRRLFPGYWRHQDARGATRPFYRVRVRDAEELRLARAAKPRYVRATFSVEPGERKAA